MSIKTSTRIMMILMVVAFFAAIGVIAFSLDYYYFVTHPEQYAAQARMISSVSSEKPLPPVTQRFVSPTRTNMEIPIITAGSSADYMLPKGELFHSIFSDRYDGLRVVSFNSEFRLYCTWSLTELKRSSPTPVVCIKEQ